jgi:gamma-carbonic anhydrase
MHLQERLNCYLKKVPTIDSSVFIAKQVFMIGDVTIRAQASVWPNAVIRGDINSIVIGEGSNIQDGVIVHLADEFGVEIGNYVTVGHGAIVHASTIEDECLIGMRATIMDGAIVGHHSIVGAHALITQGTVIPAGSLVLGSPAKVVRRLTFEEQADIKSWATKYIELAAYYKELFSRT